MKSSLFFSLQLVDLYLILRSVIIIATLYKLYFFIAQASGSVQPVVNLLSACSMDIRRTHRTAPHHTTPHHTTPHHTTPQAMYVHTRRTTELAVPDKLRYEGNLAAWRRVAFLRRVGQAALTAAHHIIYRQVYVNKCKIASVLKIVQLLI